MLVSYIGECMVSMINTNNGITEPTLGYQNCSASHILIFGAYVKVRESLYTRVIIWINTTLNHIDARGILPRYEGSCMLYRPEYIESKNIIKYPYATGIKKRQHQIKTGSNIEYFAHRQQSLHALTKDAIV